MNVVGTVNVLDAVRSQRPGARVLVVSTAEVYGATDDGAGAEEDEPVAPLSPYAASKAAAELACAQAARATASTSSSRAPFPHDRARARTSGSRVGSWTRQIARLERDGRRRARGRRPDRASATSPTSATSAAPTGCCSTRRSRRHVQRRSGRRASGWRSVVELLVGLAPRARSRSSSDPSAPAGRRRAACSRATPSRLARRDRLGARDPARADPRRRARRSARVTEKRAMSERRALITGITGQDGSYLAELLLDKGYEVFGMVAPRLDRELRADRAPRSTGSRSSRATCSTRPRSSARSRRPQPHEVYNLAAQSFVPTSWRQPVLTAEFTAVGVTRHARGDPRRRPRDPLLPGVVVGDVRQGARGAADRADAVLPALAVRRREGLRALHHRQLPRVVRPLRRLGDPLQPRVAAARARVRDAQDLATAWRASSSAWPTSCGSGTSTPSATGASPATTWRRCG